VAESAAAEAQTLLATRQEMPSEQPEPATRRVGLERSGIRLIGKAAAAMMVLGFGTAAIYVFVSPVVGLAVLALGAVTMLIWSERS
jgi:hypothetical protein